MRTKSLLAALLWAVATVPLVAGEAKHLLLVGQSPDNHPKGTHEYMSGVERLAKLLEPTGGLEVEVVKADDPWSEGPELIAKADGVVIFLSEGARWIVADPRRHEAFLQLAARGGGLVALSLGDGHA